jgi:plasmid stabilization system protein ParE
MRDMDAIINSIARDRPRAAVEVVKRIIATCESLARTPTMGTACDELQEGLRFFSVWPYVIYFKSDTAVTRIYRVVHGARDAGRLFRRKP